MKNILYKLSLVCFLGVALVSCDEDRVVLDPDNGSNLFLFNEKRSNLALSEDGTTFVTDTVLVGVTSISNVDRVIPIHIDPASTATANQYEIQASSLVIPAGKFVGKVVLTGNFEELPELVKLQIALVFDDGVPVLDDKNSHVVDIFRVCPYEIADFAGTYIGVEDGGASEYEVTATVGDEPYELILTNVWGADPESETHIYLTDDLANPTVTFPKNYPAGTDNYLFDEPTYGAAYVNGQGTSSFDSCALTITLDFEVVVSAGSFGDTNLVLTKQ